MSTPPKTDTEAAAGPGFCIPAELMLDQAPACLDDLKAALAGCDGATRLTLSIGAGRASQLALELLFSAAKSAETGARLHFDTGARAILDARSSQSETAVELQ